MTIKLLGYYTGIRSAWHDFPYYSIKFADIVEGGNIYPINIGSGVRKVDIRVGDYLEVERDSSFHYRVIYKRLAQTEVTDGEITSIVRDEYSHTLCNIRYVTFNNTRDGYQQVDKLCFLKNVNRPFRLGQIVTIVKFGDHVFTSDNDCLMEWRVFDFTEVPLSRKHIGDLEAVNWLRDGF